MEKKNFKISIKTFEDFKADSENYSAEVLSYFKEILAYLNKHGVKEVNTKYNIKMVDAGNWQIEGNVYTSDLNTEDDTLETELFFHHINGQDSINVDVSGYGELIHDDKGDWDNPPYSESESHLSIDSITLWKEDGSYDYAIVPTGEVEKTLMEIIQKIAK